jgi:hypothetical protein
MAGVPIAILEYVVILRAKARYWNSTEDRNLGFSKILELQYLPVIPNFRLFGYVRKIRFHFA